MRDTSTPTNGEPDARPPAGPPRQAGPAAVLGCALFVGVLALLVLLLVVWISRTSGSHGVADDGSQGAAAPPRTPSVTGSAEPGRRAGAVITPAKVSPAPGGMSAGAAGG
ncbi:hypothetical protein VSH64_48430 [Amycolatopsis rhabdoformis]|uniref:Serine/threonine protein kinase n=1 Tax=Amycolatopsis rhabdoformis TaxID=1448059 RepID=A0ABZ1I8M8_9PSEU|nr:hypothetical protein [Amycolatopsis rhabdoformis]WSE30534.1 hypothetical protein VSH64_48430 [Amycolatopsis rhabdoformis]